MSRLPVARCGRCHGRVSARNGGRRTVRIHALRPDFGVQRIAHRSRMRHVSQRLRGSRRAAGISVTIEARSDDDEGRVHRRDETVRLLVDRLGGGGSRRELPGTHEGALLEALEVTLREALELNRREAIDAAGEGFEEASIAV